jgi:hypothetical protein
MGQLNAANTSYPTAIDTASTLTDGSSGDVIVAANQNGPNTAIIAIETALGTVPAGTLADVKTRLNVSQNTEGVVTLGTAGSTVGVLPFNRGGISQNLASTTSTSNGFLWGFANGVPAPVTLTHADPTVLSVVPTSGTWTFTLINSGKISGDLVQRMYAASATVATCTTTIPRDNTPPMSTEGDQVLSVSIKPRTSGNRINVCAHVFLSAGAGVPVASLIEAASTSACAAITSGQNTSANNITALTLCYQTTTQTTNTLTYAVRGGCSTAGTWTLNGESGSQLLGNVLTSAVWADEIQN